MILKFRMLSDENDNFVRDFEVMPEMTLAGLHDFIIESLGVTTTASLRFLRRMTTGTDCASSR